MQKLSFLHHMPAVLDQGQQGFQSFRRQCYGMTVAEKDLLYRVQKKGPKRITVIGLHSHEAFKTF